MNNGDEPAYPCTIEGVQYPGMTKRERFAMAAMQGLCGDFGKRGQACSASVAATAWCYADALLAELEKRDEPTSSENVS